MWINGSSNCPKEAAGRPHLLRAERGCGGGPDTHSAKERVALQQEELSGMEPAQRVQHDSAHSHTPTPPYATAQCKESEMTEHTYSSTCCLLCARHSARHQACKGVSDTDPRRACLAEVYGNPITQSLRVSGCTTLNFTFFDCSEWILFGYFIKAWSIFSEASYQPSYAVCQPVGFPAW